MHGFLPNFQDMFTPIGSTSVKLLDCVWQQLLPWQDCKYFLVLNFLIEIRGAVKPMLLQLPFYLPPAKGQGWEIMIIPYCVCAFVTFLHKPLYLIHL